MISSLIVFAYLGPETILPDDFGPGRGGGRGDAVRS